MPVAWCLASPAIGEREVAGGLLAHTGRICAVRPVLTLIGDKGFAGQEFEDLVTTGFGLHLVLPDRRDEAPVTARSAGSGSGSSRSTTPSKASWTWNATAAAPPKASTPVSPSGCWPWPCASGTTGPPPNPSSVADRL